jgi:RNA polymerase sigma-70 factor (ECF subfamily)
MNKQDTISITTILDLKAGDNEAFKIVYQHLSDKLYYNLLKLVKSSDTAEELLQEAFIKLWEKRDHIDPTKSIQGYLLRITENLAYDFYRKVAKDKKLQTQLIARAEESYNHIEEILINKEFDDLLHQAIDALPPRRRQIFCLCKLDGKSYEEAAAQLKLSPSTISDHIVKATRFIRLYCLTKHPLLVLFCSYIITINH